MNFLRGQPGSQSGSWLTGLKHGYRDSSLPKRHKKKVSGPAIPISIFCVKLHYLAAGSFFLFSVPILELLINLVI